MDASHSPKMDTKVLELKPDAQSSKRRKMVEKKVVTVRIAANAGNLKNEGPPFDFWSWRKYGQKPIKGSPYPRGYYRCSTSKGCSAKKQVERCRTDSSMLVVTYTSSHNHSGPNPPNFKPNQQPNEHSKAQVQPTEDHHPSTLPKQEHFVEEDDVNEDQPVMNISDELACKGQNNEFHYLQSPFRSSQDIMINHHEDPFIDNPEKTHEVVSILLDDEPIACNEQVTVSATPKSEENDFFDELEELPMSSSFTSFMRGNVFDERIPAVPS